MALKEDEQVLMEVLRSHKKLTRLRIRFDRNGEMDLLELTKDQIVKSLHEIENLIKGGAYRDIVLSTDGKRLLKFENTRKIKLK